MKRKGRGSYKKKKKSEKYEITFSVVSSMMKKLDQTKPLVQAPEYRTTLNNWTLLLIDKRIDPSKKKKEQKNR